MLKWAYPPLKLEYDMLPYKQKAHAVEMSENLFFVSWGVFFNVRQPGWYLVAQAGLQMNNSSKQGWTRQK